MIQSDNIQLQFQLDEYKDTIESLEREQSEDVLEIKKTGVESYDECIAHKESIRVQNFDTNSCTYNEEEFTRLNYPKLELVKVGLPDDFNMYSKLCFASGQVCRFSLDSKYIENGQGKRLLQNLPELSNKQSMQLTGLEICSVDDDYCKFTELYHIEICTFDENNDTGTAWFNEGEVCEEFSV